MEIRQWLNEQFRAIQDTEGAEALVAEVAAFLRDAGSGALQDAVAGKAIGTREEQQRINDLDNALDRAQECIAESLRLRALAGRLAELEELRRERDNLKSKVERAKSLIEEARQDTQRAGLAVMKDADRKLQTVRDRVVGIAESSAFLARQAGEGHPQVIIDTANNLLLAVSVIVGEMEKAGFWDESQPRPNTTLAAAAPESQEPRKKAGRPRKSDQAAAADGGGCPMVEQLQITQQP